MPKLSVVQARLDKKKWLSSEQDGQDKSGKMDYCSVCDFRCFEDCVLAHSDRVKQTQCAKAYQKFIKIPKKK